MYSLYLFSIEPIKQSVLVHESSYLKSLLVSAQLKLEIVQQVLTMLDTVKVCLYKPTQICGFSQRRNSCMSYNCRSFPGLTSGIHKVAGFYVSFVLQLQLLLWVEGKSGFNVSFVYTACTQAVYTGSSFTFRRNKRHKHMTQHDQQHFSALAKRNFSFKLNKQEKTHYDFSLLPMLNQPNRRVIFN